MKTSTGKQIFNLRENGFLNLFFVVIAVAMSFLTLMGAVRAGISWDEEIQMNLLHGLQWASDPGNERHFGVYGLSFLLLGHAAAVLATLEPAGQTEFAPANFYARHLVVAVLAILSAWSVSSIVRWLTGSKTWSLWAFAAVLVTPVFVGHAYFNSKDVPVAAGYIFFTLSVIAALRGLNGKVKETRKYLAGVITVAAFGVWLAVGTRFGMLYPLAFTVAVIYLLLFLGVKSGVIQGASRALSTALPVGFAAGMLMVALTNPCLVAPISDGCNGGLALLPKIFGSSLSYPWGGGLFVVGETLSGSDPPFWFLPLALFAGFPLLMTAAAVVGVIFYWENAPVPPNANMKTKKLLNVSSQRFVLVLMGLVIGMQAFVIPLVVILLRGTIYDMQRQHLYVYPALVCFSALGFSLIWTKISASKRWGSLGRSLVGLVSAVALVVPLVEIVRLFPYGYVYVNPVMTIGGFEGRFDSDYWGVSLKEAYENAPTDLAVVGSMPYWVVTPFARGYGETSRTGDLEPLRPVGEKVAYLQPHRPSGGLAQVPQDCEVIHTVTRTFRGEQIPMSYVAICPARSVDLTFRIA